MMKFISPRRKILQRFVLRVRIKVKTQADLINTQSRDKANVWPSLRNTVNIFPFLDLDPIKAVLFGDI